jgi:aryl-alcohol dehydrogenase-like predicted oxidoreductase
VLIGASRPEHVEAAVAASQVDLPAQTLRAIDEVLQTAPLDQYTGRPHVRAKRR